MANRRMFSKIITNSDIFLEMPISSQTLYFHLGVNADDDGFVQAKSIMRQIGAQEDDLKILIAKRFLIRFDDGVIVITDWKINNEIRSDRYKPTFYQEHVKTLALDVNNRYIEASTDLVLPKNNHLDTQVRLGKVSIGYKEKEIDKEKETNATPKGIRPCEVLKNSLSPLNRYELWHIANLLNVSMGVVFRKQESLLLMIKDGTFQAKYKKHKSLYYTLLQWIRGDIQKGYTQTLGDFSHNLVSDDPDYNEETKAMYDNYDRRIKEDFL